MQAFENIFIRINAWVLIAILSAMSMIVFANVSLRYLTNFSIIWAEEVARYLMIWMTFLGAGLVLRAGGHVSVTLIQEVLPQRISILMRAVVATLLLFFFVFMIWAGIGYLMRMGHQLTPATRIPFSYVYAAMPIGFAFLALHLLLIIRPFVLVGSMSRADDDAAVSPSAG